MKWLMFLLIPFVVFSQWGLSNVEFIESVPKAISDQFYCATMYENGKTIISDSLEPIVNFSQGPGLMLFYHEFMQIKRIITGYRSSEGCGYYCIETPKWTFLVQDRVDDGFRFMQAISVKGRSIKYLLKKG